MPNDDVTIPPPKLLLVDDVAGNLTALAAVFESLRCELVFAASGEEALRAVLQDDFAAILLDVQMPGLDGFETATIIRGRARSRRVPILFLTAYSKEREAIFKGYEHGAVDYLVKPFHPDILRAKISVFLELHEKRELVRARAEERVRMTRLELVRETASRLQQLVDGLPHCVWRLRPDGALELVNRAWTTFSGLDRCGSDRGRWLSVVHPDDRGDTIQRFRSCLAAGEPFEGELRLRRHDGVYRWFLVRVVPEHDDTGALAGFIGTATDIDDQRRDREMLAAALEAKDEFLAGASHELRTPLAAAKAQIQLTQRRLPPDTDSRLARALGTVASQIDRMTRLVEDLLDVGRLRTGRLSLQVLEFDFVERVRAEIDRMRALTETHTFILEAPESLRISADCDRLEQVMVNLLTNAVRYSPGGGPIAIRVSAEEDRLRVSVSDRGIGVPAEKQATIFERFGRAHGARYGGLGLGLTIAQGIVEQHGGRIWVESCGVPGEGSTFCFEIPARLETRLSVA